MEVSQGGDPIRQVEEELHRGRDRRLVDSGAIVLIKKAKEVGGVGWSSG
jgi:hypothetical protein